MEAHSTSHNLPGPSPAHSATSPTSSIANGRITATKKRRASTSASRGVANLTPEQLAKKRANDREAQRAIRERTKGQIENLERKIQELTSQQPYLELQNAIRQKEIVEAENEDIKRRLSQVLGIIQPLLCGNENLNPDYRETPGLRLDCNPRTTGVVQNGLQPLSHNPETPSLRSATSSTSTYGASPQTLRQTPPMQHPASLPAPAAIPAHALDRQRSNIAHGLDLRASGEKLDLGFLLDGRQVPQDARQQPCPTSTPACHDQAANITHVSNPISHGKVETRLEPSIRAFSTPVRNSAPTCPLDSLLLDFMHERQQRAAEGLAHHKLVGPAYPSVSSLLNPENSCYSHPLSKVFTDIIRTFPDIARLQEQVAVVYVMFLIMRWQISPSQENYDRLPEWVTPRPSQLFTPHPAWIDHIPWPRMRDKMVHLYPSVPFDRFFIPYTTTLSLNWPYEQTDTLISLPGREELSINPVFERHLRDLNNWSLGPAFAKAFPVLAETTTIKGDGAEMLTGSYYNFSNIRYAAPPVGNLRFRDPQPPLQDRGNGVLDGTNASICPQAAPASWNWDNAGLPEGDVIPIGNSTLPESEDCLFLDVVVPTSVYHNRRRKLVPVLVNIHGGGFFIGDKATLYPPQGLLAASSNAIVFVSMNYRLTAFGFLGGLENATSNATSPNAGLLDQRFALQWIQKHIHLFGGDPHRVTILGESGGGASVMFHTIAYGASKPRENSLFHQVIAQSPGPQVGKGNNQHLVSNAFLHALNVSNVDEARNLPSDVLMAANRKIEASTPYFGPFVDGDLIPDLPSRLYTSGRSIKGLRVMTGHNANEARLFIPPTSNSQASFDAFIASQFPTASPSQIVYINHTLYPSTQYASQNARLSLLDADVYNLCWTVLLAATYTPAAYSYVFAVPPAYHAQDLAYTFYNGASFQHGVNVTVARTLQKYITNFVLGGDPNGVSVPDFPAWSTTVDDVVRRKGEGARVVNLTTEGVLLGREDAVGRCGWWFETGFAGSN